MTETRLSFDMLRAANTARLPLFKNRKGEPAHSEPDGSDWSLGDWSNAVLGEIGEAANIIKKIKRGDITLEEARPALAKEFADAVAYLDILAMRAGIDLGEATSQKWDEVSERIGVLLRMEHFSGRTRSLGILVAERIRSEHVVDRTKVGPDVIFLCSCKARWTMPRTASQENLDESVRSHLISVGLRPSEIL
jgi:NTP pyrophosphatase (non-canonical NTP hydrolase)